MNGLGGVLSNVKARHSIHNLYEAAATAAFCPELQGCYTQGETYEEALENIRDAIRLHVEDRLESGEGIPYVEFISLTSLEVAV